MQHIRVDCYCGHRGEQTPRQFWLAERRVTVVEVLDCWLAPDHRYFKVLGDDGDAYILKHDPHHQAWEMVSFTKKGSGRIKEVFQQPLLRPGGKRTQHH